MIPAAEGLYHRLILLVGKSESGKSVALNRLAKELDTSVINVNLALSELLLDLTVTQRTIRLPGLLNDVIPKGQSLILLDNTEILFDPELKQDPFRLLQGISRNQTIIATWNGACDQNKLVYAEMNHPEYRRYDPKDTIILCLNE